MTSPNACQQSLVHLVVLVHFSVRKKGLSLSVKRVMKRPSTARQPMRRYSSFLALGANVSMTTLIWSGLNSIPLCVTINLRNLPALTLKTHLEGVKLHVVIPY